MTLKTPGKRPKELLCRIPVLNRQRQVKFDRRSVALFCSRLLESLNMADRSLSIVFVGRREMRGMNHRFRGRDYATDVLSFPYGEMKMEGMPFLGEIVIAPGVAVDQALRYGVRPDKEIRKLLVHGMLHLLGYDHETDRGEMNRVQAALLRRKCCLSESPLLPEVPR